MKIPGGAQYDYLRMDKKEAHKALHKNSEAADKMKAAMGADNGKGKTQAGAAEEAAGSASPVAEMMYSGNVAKLRSGQELSGYELSVLKKKNPGLYAKAVRAQQARMEMRKKLDKAKTSRDFDAAHSEVGALAAAAVSESKALEKAGAGAEEGVGGQFAVSHSAVSHEFGQFSAKRRRVALEERLAEREKGERKAGRTVRA